MTMQRTLIGLALGVILSGSTLFFQKLSADSVIWIGYYFAIIFIIQRLPYQTPTEEASPLSRAERWMLASVIIFGAIIRLYKVTSLPSGIWFDEAQNAIVDRQLLANQKAWPVYVTGLSQLPLIAFLYQLPFVVLFPENIDGIRISAAVSGIGAIFSTWLLAEAWFGRRVGIAAAGFIALSPWQLSFSRFGMVQVVGTFVFPLMYWLIDRAVVNNCIRCAAWAGFAAGIGAQTYYGCIWMLPLGIIAILVLSLSFTSLRNISVILAVFALIGCATFIPAASAIVSYPEVYFARFNQVSSVTRDLVWAYLKSPSESTWQTLLPLWESVMKHLRMFNWQGDANGRHNLSMAPMLEPIVGILFLQGLLTTVVRFPRRREAILLLTFLVVLAGGIFSVAFEAPQSGRTVVNSALCAIFAGIGFAALERSSDWMRGALPLLLAWNVWYTTDRYFNQQLSSTRTWYEFSPAETYIGRERLNRPKDEPFYVSETWVNTPTINLLAGDLSNEVKPFEPYDVLPIPCKSMHTSGKSAYFFLRPDQQEERSLLTTLYPKGESSQVRSPDMRLFLLDSYEVDPSEVERTCLSAMSLDDHAREILLPLEVGGAYTIQNKGTEMVGISIGQSSVALAPGATLPPMQLLSGLHRMIIEPAQGVRDLVINNRRDTDRIADIAFDASTTQVGGLTVKYESMVRPSLNFSRIEPTVSRYIHFLPIAIPFKITWSGYILPPKSGDYAFSLQSRDRATLTIGTAPSVTSQPGVQGNATIRLETSATPFTLEFTAETGFIFVSLLWREPDSPTLITIPSKYFRPTG